MPFVDTWAGNLIRFARLQTGMSQRELARKAQTSQATISAYEAGRKDPSLTTLVRIVRATGFDLRITLGPQDDHDEGLHRYEQTLPRAARERYRRQQLAIINRARRLRGLAPVKAEDLRGKRL